MADRHRRRLARALVVPLLCAQLLAQTDAPAPGVALSKQPAQPGDVVRIEVRGASAAEEVTGTLLNKPLLFAFLPQRDVWEALAGIDLQTKPGAYRVTIGISGGRALSETLRVSPRKFPTRRLRVPAGFVNPPKDALERIARENKVLAGLYAGVTPRRWESAFILPVEGKPTSNFGTRSVYNGRPRAPHAGVDFVGEPGTPIRAANYGTVALAEPLYFTGNTVVVDHGTGLYSLFAHLSEFRVKSGDPVTPETIVGLVGATGRVTGPHLHWSIRLQGARVDPLSLVAATQ